MIIAANKSSKEVIDDESKRAFYKNAFQYSAKLTGIRILHRITLNF
jgi:hypothetical protein